MNGPKSTFRSAVKTEVGRSAHVDGLHLLVARSKQKTVKKIARARREAPDEPVVHFVKATRTGSMASTAARCEVMSG